MPVEKGTDEYYTLLHREDLNVVVAEARRQPVQSKNIVTRPQLEEDTCAEREFEASCLELSGADGGLATVVSGDD